MFEKEIHKYDSLLIKYREQVSGKIHPDDFKERHEILFSAHSCGIEGNSFTVGDTKELKEKGLSVIPQGKTLFEAFEMLDHFKAYEFLMSQTDQPLSEDLLKETHRLLTLNTLPYKVKDAQPGEYTDTDMCAGETVFGDHKKLIARVPDLLSSTQKVIEKVLSSESGVLNSESGVLNSESGVLSSESGVLSSPNYHPIVIAARFHGFFEYLHPFRDGNGRLGRLFSNFILKKLGHPMLIIDLAQRQNYISALNAIRTEGTDEYLISFFFNTAISQMERELKDKTTNTLRSLLPFVF